MELPGIVPVNSDNQPVLCLNFKISAKRRGTISNWLEILESDEWQIDIELLIEHAIRQRNTPPAMEECMQSRKSNTGL